MKEIRIHGRGGMGTVKAAEILVYAAVRDNKYGNSIPFFGFERQGAPVTAYLRLDERPIRPKNQVYEPNCVIILDPTIMNAVNVFEGLQESSVFVVNSAESLEKLALPACVKTAAVVDATAIALDLLGRPITNSVMLGAFAKATGWAKMEYIEERVRELFGAKNVEALKKGFELAKVYNL